MLTNRHSSNTRWSDTNLERWISIARKVFRKDDTNAIYLCTIQNQFLIQKRCVHFDKHTRNILEITKSCSIFFQSADFQLKGVCIYPLISTWGLFVGLK